MRTGGNIYLNPKEEMADEILLKMKEKSILRGINDPASFSPSMHFFRAKALIDKDPIFDIIKRFPKGGLLHIHNTAAVSSEWIIKNLTYSSEIKLCNGSSGFMLVCLWVKLLFMRVEYWFKISFKKFFELFMQKLF